MFCLLLQRKPQEPKIEISQGQPLRRNSIDRKQSNFKGNMTPSGKSPSTHGNGKEDIPSKSVATMNNKYTSAVFNNAPKNAVNRCSTAVNGRGKNEENQTLAFQNRRNSDGVSLSYIKNLQSHQQSNHRLNESDLVNKTSSLSKNSLHKLSSEFLTRCTPDFSSIIQSDNKKHGRQDITSLFGSYSSLTNLGTAYRAPSNLDRSKINSSRNFSYHMNTIPYQSPSMQCVSPAYATISSSAFRELTQKVK